ncbi:MAG: glycosyltransferase family 2 protein [Clostridia bacterium]|nr:glycosyltransferase family 2 protein [Clostridia bacterium]
MDYKTVSVVVPILNEEKYIKKCLDSLLEQDYPKEKMEILLVDGGSTDGTPDIVAQYTQEYTYMKTVENPKKTVQYAMNVGIENASGYYIVRMDAHAEYANDYISKCVEYSEKTGAENVGGTTVVRGKSLVQKIIAASYHSPFALGGSRHYDESYEGYADTVAWGTFKRETLLKLGMYDERLPRSEDDDLNFRITESGGKIFVTPKIRSIYYPKDSFSKLFRQYFEYGKWKVAVIKKHKKPSRIAHLVPMAFVAFIVLFGMLSFAFPIVAKAFCGIMALYFLLDAYFSFRSKHIQGFSNKLGLMYAHLVLHISYGLGFWAGIFKFWNYKW